MEEVAYGIINFYSSFFGLLVFSLLFTLSAFYFVKQFLKNFNTNIIYPCIFGCINGCTAILMETNMGGSFPYLIIVLVPIFVTLEIMIVSRNSLKVSIFVLGGFLINFGTIYTISVAIIGYFYNIKTFVTTSVKLNTLQFSMALTLAAIVLVILSYKMPVKELSSLLYKKGKLKILITYMYVIAFALVVSSFLYSPLIGQRGMSLQLTKIFYLEIILKDAVMLAGSYIIVLFKCKEEKIVLEKELVHSELNREKGFRNSTQKNSLLSYSYNATRNILENTDGFFDRFITDNEKISYIDLIFMLIEKMVYPEDVDRLKESLVIGVDQEIATERQSSNRFRVSKSACVWLFKDYPKIADIKKIDSEWIWLESKNTFVVDPVTGDLIVYVDLINVNDEIEKQQSLIELASIDGLTGLYNKITAEKTIKNYLEKENHDGSLFIIDMDNFKSVNDNLGHPIGDVLLKNAAQLIKSVFRHHDLVSRMGGDEFCVFAFDLISEDLMKKKAEELVQKGQFHFKSPTGNPIHVTFSVGGACTTETGRSYKDVYAMADKALYEAKRAGKNCSRIFRKE